MSCCAVIVSYNSGRELAKCMPAYAKCGIDVVVVENGDYDPVISSQISTYVHGHGNIGYGAALNLGYRTAIELSGQDYTWIVCANADALPSEALLKAVCSDDLGAFDVVGFSSGDNSADRRLIPSPRSAFQYVFFGEAGAVARASGAQLYPVGAMLAIRGSAFETLRGFDRRYFLYFEEVDFCMRAREAELRVGFADRGLRYEHEGGSSTKSMGKAAAFELGRSAGIYYASRPSPGLMVWILGDFLRWTALMMRAMARLRFRRALSNARTIHGLTMQMLSPDTARRMSEVAFHRTPYRASNGPGEMKDDEQRFRRNVRCALLVVFEDPRHRRSGSSIRNWAILRGLVARFEVTCVVMSGDLAGPEYGGGVRFVAGSQRSLAGTALASVFKRQQWMTARYDTRRTRTVIRDQLELTDLVVGSAINSVTIIVRAGRTGARRNVPIVWDTQNFDPEVWQLSARDSRGARSVLARREETLSVRVALSLHPHVSEVIAVSERDKKAWESLLGSRAKVSVAPNGASDEWTSVLDAAKTPGLVVSFGSLGQRMTADGLVDFLRNEWKELHDSLPDLNLLIVGRDPRRDLLQLAHAATGVDILANPTDIVSAVSHAELFVFPQVRGYGSKIKLYEALATGRPIVASPAALVGIPDHLLSNVTCADPDWLSAILHARTRGSVPLTSAQRDEVGSGEQIRCLDEVYSRYLR